MAACIELIATVTALPLRQLSLAWTMRKVKELSRHLDEADVNVVQLAYDATTTVTDLNPAATASNTHLVERLQRDEVADKQATAA